MTADTPSVGDRLRVLSVRNEGTAPLMNLSIKINLDRVTSPFRYTLASVDEPESERYAEDYLRVKYARLVPGDEIAIIWSHAFGEVRGEDIEIVSDKGKIVLDNVRILRRLP